MNTSQEKYLLNLCLSCLYRWWTSTALKNLLLLYCQETCRHLYFYSRTPYIRINFCPTECNCLPYCVALFALLIFRNYLHCFTRPVQYPWPNLVQLVWVFRLDRTTDQKYSLITGPEHIHSIPKNISEWCFFFLAHETTPPYSVTGYT